MAKKSRVKSIAEKKGVSVPDLIIETLNTSDTAQDAAKELKITYRTLWGYMKRYNIEQHSYYRIKENA